MTFEVEELFVLWGIVFAVLEVEAEQEPVHFSRIEVVQGDVSQSASSKNWLLLGNETVLAGPLTSPDPEQEPEAVGSVSRVYTYLAYFADPDAAGQISAQQPFQVFIHGEQGRISRSVVNPARFSPERLATTEIGKAVVEIVRDLGPPEIATLFHSSVCVQSPEALGPFFIDRAVAGGSGLVVDGWIGGLGDREVHLVTGDLSVLVKKSAWALRRRPDVHEHLAKTGALKTRSDIHGFAAVLPVETAENVRELFFLECDPSHDRTTFYGPVTTNLRKDDKEALQIVRHSFGEIQSVPRELVSRALSPLPGAPKE